MASIIKRRLLSVDAFFIALVIVPCFLLVPEARADNCKITSTHRAKANTVQVAKVIDGDTIRLSNGKLVRFIGINTPEIDHKTGKSDPFAEKARDYLKSKVSRFKGRLVLLAGEEKHDRHGRLLAHVFSPTGQNIQADILLNGFGVWIVVPPNLNYMDCYRENESQARMSHSGVWGEQYQQPLDVADLTEKNRGFNWIRGKIIRIGKGRKNWWLNFEDRYEDRVPRQKFSKVALRVNKDDLHYFKEQSLERLLNKVVTVRGWVSKYKSQIVMTLRHPASLEINNQ